MPGAGGMMRGGTPMNPGGVAGMLKMDPAKPWYMSQPFDHGYPFSRLPTYNSWSDPMGNEADQTVFPGRVEDQEPRISVDSRQDGGPWKPQEGFRHGAEGYGGGSMFGNTRGTYRLGGSHGGPAWWLTGGVQPAAPAATTVAATTAAPQQAVNRQVQMPTRRSMPNLGPGVMKKKK